MSQKFVHCHLGVVIHHVSVLMSSIPGIKYNIIIKSHDIEKLSPTQNYMTYFGTFFNDIWN